MTEEALDHKKVSRGTKCFSAQSATGYPGSYPVGFLEWLQEMGWWGDKRIHLCAGGVGRIDPDSVRVDIQEEVEPSLHGLNRDEGGACSKNLKATPTIIADARDTGLDPESYNWVGIDPPYSKELAEKLYGTGNVYSGIQVFAQEGWRLLEPGGLLVTFSYAISDRPSHDADLIACWGIYQIPNVRNMTCLNVWRKRGLAKPQGLMRWTE